MPASLSTLAQRPLVVATAFNRNFGFDLSGIFPAGSLTGTPTVTVVGASQTYATGAAVSTGDIVPGAAAVNSGSFTNYVTNRIVLAGYGVQCQINGGSAVDGGNYLLKVTASDGTNTDSLFCLLQVRGSSQPVP